MANEKYWTSSNGRIELLLTYDQIYSVPSMGEADQFVAELRKEESIREQLDNISDTTLAQELHDYTDWDLSDRVTNEERLLWIATLDLQEQIFEEGGYCDNCGGTAPEDELKTLNENSDSRICLDCRNEFRNEQEDNNSPHRVT